VTPGMRLLGAIVGLCLIGGALVPCVAAVDVVPSPSARHAAPPQPRSGPVPEPPRPGGPRSVGFEAGLLEGLYLFLFPLLMTLVVEVPVVAIAGRASMASWKAGVLVNTLTNPLAVSSILALASLALLVAAPVAILVVLAVEAVVVIAEARLFQWVLGWSNRKAVVTSVTANVLSFGLGVVAVSWYTGI